MNVLIITYYRYPNGDAGAIRQHTFAKLYKSIGYQVFVIGVGNSPYLKQKSFDGVEYVSFRNKGTNLIAKVKNILGYRKNLAKFLELTENKYDIVQVANIPIQVLIWVKKYAKKNKIKLIHDSVEWYSHSQFRMGRLSPTFILKELDNRILIDKFFYVIAISKILEKHFASRGIKSTRIPAILDVQNISFQKKINDKKLTIVYAGSPGKKDYQKEVIDGIALLTSEELERIELRVFGASKEQLIRVSGVNSQNLNKLTENIKIFGRVSREMILENLEQADFTVLLRPPDQRYAKAGFPTKVVESLASGTPVLCNITSDLGDYICDGENGIIVEECTASSFALSIKRALDLTYDDRVIMQKNARKTAQENFDFRLYESSIRLLLDGQKQLKTSNTISN